MIKIPALIMLSMKETVVSKGDAFNQINFMINHLDKFDIIGIWFYF